MLSKLIFIILIYTKVGAFFSETQCSCLEGYRPSFSATHVPTMSRLWTVCVHCNM